MLRSLFERLWCLRKQQAVRLHSYDDIQRIVVCRAEFAVNTISAKMRRRMYIHCQQTNKDCLQEYDADLLRLLIHCYQYMTLLCANCCDKRVLSWHR